jgi:hypothetical protein
MPAKRPIHEFLLAVGILLFVPLLPLFLEMGVMVIFKTAASRYLEPASVMIAAPMLAVAVGLASRYKSIAMACGIAALCLGALYGGQLAQPEQREAVSTAEQQVHKADPVKTAAQPSPKSDSLGWSRM